VHAIPGYLAIYSVHGCDGDVRNVGSSLPRDLAEPVLVNAAAALVAAGRAETFLEAMALGVVSIDSGAARGKVEALAGFRVGD
jgi:anthranilate phosphoribosyltransferase